jgi:hypothetical protein
MRERVVEYFEPIPSPRLDATVSSIVIENALGNSAYRVWIAIEPPSRHQQVKLIHFARLAFVSPPERPLGCSELAALAFVR